MKKQSWLVAVIAIAVLFFQCQKELGYTGGPDTNNPVLPDPITASVQGNITDENDQPAAGVTVTAGTSTTVTDANGYFRFTDARLDKNTTMVTASKDGYFKGYRVFAATSGCNQVVLKLIKKDLAGTVTASAGGEVSLNSGAKINLPAGGIVMASSNGAYAGDVKVYASYINPKSTDIGKTIPGSFVANNKDGKRVTLQSYGMLAIELSSSGGEKLQIKSGSMATLTIPIPSQSAASAPATIPLWYVDETTGIWQEEGTATKQGSSYVGEVKHFSFWNCDYPLDAVSLSLTLHTPSNAPLVNATVRISGVTSDTSTSVSSAYGYTDSLGQVKGLVPANTNLTLEVLGTCGGITVYSQDLSPLTQNKDLGTIKITDNTSSLLTLTGTVVNCSNTPVTNGYASVSVDGLRRYVATDNEGHFTTTYIICSASTASVFFSGVDADAHQESDQSQQTVSLPSADLGTITACGNAVEDQYINYTIDGTAYTITSLSGDSLAAYQLGNDTRVYGWTIATPNRFLGFKIYNTTGTGTFQMGELSVASGDTVSIVTPSPVATFTGFPSAPGEYFQGHFDGLTYRDSLQAQHTISATFKIKQ